MKTQKIKIDYDSSENQRIKEKFINRDVYTCFSYEMDQILKSNIGEELLDTIENLYIPTCCQCGKTFDNPAPDDCPECSKAIESEPQEIFEWWIVSSYLYRKLKAKNEPVLEWGNNYYWGRCTTGQAILLDYVVSVICEEMEILEGQKYSWAERHSK